jgi:D-amino-acid dehydrogenase
MLERHNDGLGSDLPDAGNRVPSPRAVDVIVLGAGIVGVSTALHLLKRGLSVALVDHQAPGLETSDANAGIVDGSGCPPALFPESLPGEWSAMRQGRSPHRLDWMSARQWLGPFLRMGLRGAGDRLALSRTLGPLMRQALLEHRALLRLASAERFLRDTGYLDIYRSAAGFDRAGALIDAARGLGASPEILTAQEVTDLEPALRPIFSRAVLWRDSFSVSDPGLVTKRFADLFGAWGGLVAIGEAAELTREAGGWRLVTDRGLLTGPRVVLCLGPWTGEMLTRLRRPLPFAPLRGYRRHYAAPEGSDLALPVVDVEAGFALTPTGRGVRLTTGREWAGMHRPVSHRPIHRAIEQARDLFPLGEPRDQVMVATRTALPDGLPVVGAVPGIEGLWVNAGHGALGYTLGPVTARLLTDLLTNQPSTLDATPFACERLAGGWRGLLPGRKSAPAPAPAA